MPEGHEVVLVANYTGEPIQHISTKEGETATSPNLLAKAANLATAVVKHAADGFRAASPEVQAERKRICEACPNLDPTSKACRLCGCIFMDKKRAMASESCPDNPPRWTAEPI